MFDISKTHYITKIEPAVLKFKSVIEPEDQDKFWLSYSSTSTHRKLSEFDTRENVKYEWLWIPNWEFRQGRDMQHIRICTEDRHLLIKYRDVLNSLIFDDVHIQYQKSWRWTDENICGEMVHLSRDVFEFFISSSHEWCASKLNIPELCETRNPWYDVGVFDFQRHRGIEGCCTGYQWTKHGFLCSIYGSTKKDNKVQRFVDAYKGICDGDIVSKGDSRGHYIVELFFK